MTKREICERLQNIRDYARVTDTWPHDNAAEQNLHLRNAVEAIAKDLGELLLDIAAPEEEEQKKEKKEPPVLIYEENGEKVPCPVCGATALPIKNTNGVFYCKRCEGFFNCQEEGK